MSGEIDAKLTELGLSLPAAAAPVGNYVPATITGNLIFTSGQITLDNGTIAFIGKLGQEFSVEQGYAAARLCAINVISQVKAALGGDLDRVVRVVKVVGFVNSLPDFTDQPAVVNGASDLFVQVFADKGKHARSAVGVSSLPRGVAVEVEAIVEFK
jgi:enamine deaminase RidA (YjgF/YER057c/UK114 family)